MKKLAYASLITATVIAASTAIAADNGWKASTEFGFTQTAGNSENTSVKARFDAERNIKNWLYNFHADAINTESNGERSAEKYFISNRAGYKFTEFDYVYGYHSYEKDRFSGFDYQTSLSAGYGRRLINSDTTKLDFEIGPGYRWSKLVNGDKEDESILRLFGHFNHKVSDTTEFDQTVNVETGGDSTVTRSVSSLKVKMTDALSLRASYTVNYNDTVPSGTKHADTETALTVVYDF